MDIHVETLTCLNALEGCDDGGLEGTPPELPGLWPTGGNGGSDTSASVRTGKGAAAGGVEPGAANCNRPPGGTGFINTGVSLPGLRHEFPAPGDNVYITPYIKHKIY